MVTEQAGVQELDRSLMGTLEVSGFELPLADLNFWPLVGTRLQLGDTEYTYVKSFPIRGHGAIMPKVVEELNAQGKKLLAVERLDRYYLYAA